MDAGLGVFKSSEKSKVETKLLDIGYREYLIEGFYLQVKGGGWMDSSGNPNRSSSVFLATGLQFEVNLSPVEIRTGFNLAGISNTDDYLGGHLQFNEELYIGLRDKIGNGIGLEYSHFSSGGLEMPNQGRDFIILQMSQRW